MTSLMKLAQKVLRKNRTLVCLGLGFVILLFSANPCLCDIGFSLDNGLEISYSLAEYDKNAYLETCNIEEYNKKYSTEGNCWSCDIIKTLMNSMTSAADTLGGLVTGLAMSILLVGSALWLAIYFFKSLASPAQQDVAKVLDGAFTFMFKVALVYFLISGGVGGLTGQVVNPLLSIGVDIGKTFTGA